MNKGLYLVLFIFLAWLAAPLAVTPAKAITVQYQTLSSFDFLSADEVEQFFNTTLAGEAWNSWNTTEYGQVSYSVSAGVLNITSTSGTVGAKEGLLVYPRSFNGYVEVTFTQGVIAVLAPANQSDIQVGFEIVKTSSGITVYQVNGTSKTALASISTSSNNIVITNEDGEFKVNLSDGTGVYEGSGLQDAVMALGVEAGSSAAFDKVVLYGKLLAGSYSEDLGTKTITPSTKVVSFQYDLSKYDSIQSAKLVITLTAVDDIYPRYYIVASEDPGTGAWWENRPQGTLKFGIVFRSAIIEIDMTSKLSASKTGTIYVGVSTFVGSWTASAKFVLDASITPPPENGQNGGSTTEQKQSLWDKWNSLSSTTKYLLIGAGAVFLFVLIMVFMNPGGRGGRNRGIAPILALLLIFLVLGGIAAALLAWLHPEYLTALAFGLGAIALLALLMFLAAGKSIPNPLKH